MIDGIGIVDTIRERIAEREAEAFREGAEAMRAAVIGTLLALGAPVVAAAVMHLPPPTRREDRG